jgi:integrase
VAGRNCGNALPRAYRLAQRRGDGLRWVELDLVRRTATLADTKTGRSIRPLPHAACDVLKGLPSSETDRVFPASRDDAVTILHFKKFWPRIATLGSLPSDVTPHVLRH